jgi:hypothetical protein
MLKNDIEAVDMIAEKIETEQWFHRSFRIFLYYKRIYILWIFRF